LLLVVLKSVALIVLLWMVYRSISVNAVTRWTLVGMVIAGMTDTDD
jgi:hypothetical protein